MDAEVIKILASEFNFKYKFVLERSAGGSVISVRKRTSTFGTGFLNFDWQRWQLVDFSKFTVLNEFRWECRKPQELEPFYNIVTPFQLNVWYLTTGSVLLIGKGENINLN